MREMKQFLIILVMGILIFAGVGYTDKDHRQFAVKEKLSEYGFYEGRLAELQPSANIFPYQLNSALFSNYAEKARFISMPKGMSATYNADSVFDMPVGTILIKNFYYPNDFRD